MRCHDEALAFSAFAFLSSRISDIKPGVALSINPIDIIKTFQDRGVREHKRIADYLDVVANVATELANAWTRIYRSWAQEVDNDGKKIPLRYLVGSQAMYFYEASEHYSRASAVIGRTLNETQMKELFDALGALLTTRNDTKRLYEIAEEERSHVFSEVRLDDSITLKQVEKNIELIQKEAATLRALASSIRAQP